MVLFVINSGGGLGGGGGGGVCHCYTILPLVLKLIIILNKEKYQCMFFLICPINHIEIT